MQHSLHVNRKLVASVPNTSMQSLLGIYIGGPLQGIY